MNRVYIVIVNYGKYEDTIECLESVLKSAYTCYQVILVDNSPDGNSRINLINWLSGEYKTDIVTSYPELVLPLVSKPISYLYIDELVPNEAIEIGNEKIILIRAENKGFAAANNLAFKYIKNESDDSSFIWVLNNDTVVEKNCLSKLVEFYSPDRNLYIIGSKLKFYHHKNTLQAISGRYNKWIGSTYHVGEGEHDIGQYDDYIMKDDNYIIGASLFLPVNFLRKAGPMNENYFLYFEEMDWILRGKISGFKTAVQAEAIVYHKEGASIKSLQNGNSVSDYYSIINRLKLTRIWYPQFTLTVLSSVIYAILKRLLKGKYTLALKTSRSVFNIMINKN